MSPQTSKDPAAKMPTQLQLSVGTCPSCGQDIPPDRIQEISGRIAAREREQALALTSRLESQFLAEKARIEAKAKAEFESKEKLLQSQLAALQKSKDTEIAQMRAAAAADAARIRQEAAENAAAQFRTVIADKDKALADALDR